jgi:WD40 repeat protein
LQNELSGDSLMHVFDLRPERTTIMSLAWSSDDKKLALGLSDGGLVLWDLELVNNLLAELGLDCQNTAQRSEP